MSEVGDLEAGVRGLVAHEPRLERDKPEVVGQMQRLCRAAARALPASGVGVTLISEAGPQVTVGCKVPGGPWFVGLGGLRGPEVELGPSENPAIAREDATKLRQFLALMVPDPATTHAG